MNLSRAFITESCSEHFSDEATLVMAAKNGEPDAFSELIMRNRGRIFAAALRITNNHADAEDVFQNTCLQAFVHVCRFDGRSKFVTWITRIAINCALMNLRRNRAASATSLDDLMATDSLCLRDHRADVGERILERERSANVERAIGRLRPELRNVMQIQRRHEGSIRQTAELSGLSVAATKSRLFRARQELRRHIEASA